MPQLAQDLDLPASSPTCEREIVQVVYEVSAAGGVELVAFELARAFSRAGVPNRVLASKAHGLEESATVVEPVASWLGGVRTRGAFRYLGRLLAVPAFTIAATWACRRRRGIILSHGDSLRADILVIHAVNAESLALKRRGGGLRWLLNPLHLWVQARERWMIGGLRSRVYVAVSERTAGEIVRHYHVPRARIRVIPNGVDLRRFRPDPAARKAVRAAFGIPPEAKLLLFAGHEFARKGLAHVVEALDRLTPDVWLLVVGSDGQGPYKALAQGAAGRVIFAGARSDMPALHAAADLFVLPTAYETFSLVCMEALACGVPILATPVGGIEDYLQDGVNGFFIRRDADDIAAKVTMLVADEARLAAFREAALATAARFGWDAVAAAYRALVADLDRQDQPSGGQ